MGKSRIKPEDPFPENLNQLEDNQVEVLNSKVHRQLEVEYVQEGSPNPETEHRQEEINEELDDRDLLSETHLEHAAETLSNNDDGARSATTEGALAEQFPESDSDRRY